MGEKTHGSGDHVNPVLHALMMVGYHLRHAARSLARNPAFTFVMELSLGLGVALWTVARTAVDAQDQIAVANYEHIYLVELHHEMVVRIPTEGHDPERFWDHVSNFMLTHHDAVALESVSERPHAYSFFSPMLVGKDGASPTNLRVRFTTGALFPMFEMTFAAGAPWTDAEEDDAAQVCVLTHTYAEAWFGSSAAAVGSSVRISGRDFRVVGVVLDNRAERKLYDFSAFPDDDGVYVPIETMRVLGARPLAYYPWGGSSSRFDDFLDGETAYLQTFVELPSASAVEAYEKTLADYVAVEAETNRTPKLTKSGLVPLERWSGMLTATPFKLFQLFGAIAFVACIFNLVRLLVAKFSARAGEVAIRRALGAPRITIFMQHLMEAELVSCGGAVLGLLLAAAGIAFINAVIPDRPVDFSLDIRRGLLAAASAVLAGLVAGVYPAWRICNVAPATVLRRQ